MKDELLEGMIFSDFQLLRARKDCSNSAITRIFHDSFYKDHDAKILGEKKRVP